MIDLSKKAQVEKAYSRKSLHNTTWKLMSFWTRLSSWDPVKKAYVCFTCGRTYPSYKKMQTGHLIHTANSYSRLDFEQRAIKPQCYYCNIQLYGNTLEFEDRVKEIYGPEVIDELKAMKKQKWDVWTPDTYYAIQDALSFQIQQFCGVNQGDAEFMEILSLAQAKRLAEEFEERNKR